MLPSKLAKVHWLTDCPPRATRWLIWICSDSSLLWIAEQMIVMSLWRELYRTSLTIDPPSHSSFASPDGLTRGRRLPISILNDGIRKQLILQRLRGQRWKIPKGKKRQLLLLELDPGFSFQYGFMWPWSGPRLNIAMIMHSVINRNFLHRLEKHKIWSLW